MWNRRTADIVQFSLLVFACVLASRDIDRTIRDNEKPVTQQQQQALADFVQERTQR